MTALRSLLFNLLFFVTLGGHLMLMWLGLPFRRAVLRDWVRLWTRQMLWYGRVVLGLDYRVEGREHMPEGPVVLAAKHQSAWDTFVFFDICPEPQYVMKTELRRIPFWGWYADKCEAVFVDRAGGGGALKGMVTDCRDRLAKGRQVIIFPEGTRTAPGTRLPYHPGVYAIYRALPDGVPLLPVAVNSGVFWGRRAFIKRPGTIVVRVLAPMPPGLDRKAFMAELETRVEAATAELVAEARAGLGG